MTDIDTVAKLLHAADPARQYQTLDEERTYDQNRYRLMAMAVAQPDKKLWITVDEKPVYHGTPWWFDISSNNGTTRVAVLTVPQE